MLCASFLAPAFNSFTLFHEHFPVETASLLISRVVASGNKGENIGESPYHSIRDLGGLENARLLGSDA